MKTKIIIACLLIVILMTGCAGKEKLLQVSRTVGDFNTIVFKTDGTLNITQGEAESLTIEAAEKVLPLIDSEVKDGVLTIQFKDGSISNPLSTNRISYSLLVKDLNMLEVDGRSMVNVTDLITEQLIVTINGSAIVSASGKVTSQEIFINGMGQYNAPDMASEKTKVTDNYGLLTVWATKFLDISLTSMGKVYYFGSPEVTQSVSGGGKVISRGAK